MRKINILSILMVGLLIFVMAICSQVTFAQNTTTINESESRQVVPENGTLLYSDDFSSSKSGWAIVTSGDILTMYKNGKYHLTIVPANFWNGYNAPRLNLSDFIVQVEATKEAGPDDNAFGFAIRNSAPGNFYALLISSDGYYSFSKKENNSWVIPANWTRSSAIKPGNATNLIKVIAVGNEFSFYANGEKLGNYTDSSFASGGLGLFAGSQSEGNVTISFDNFKVWSIKKSQN